jgi:hypothetical protein
MEVADADGVHVSQRSNADFGGRPRPDPWHRAQPGVRLLERHVDDLLEPRCSCRDTPDQLRAPLFDPERVVREVGKCRKRRRGRR